ncbi:MAG TPA: hypothetical protein VG538_05045 [Vicinamibacterales bacterium]|nr:hypothetical protein [Vicinamibacterales bacterium]
MTLFVIVAFFAIVGFCAWKVNQQRASAFAAAADRLGFVDKGGASPFAGSDAAGLTLLTDTMQHVYRNVLVDKRGSVVVVPEFQYALPIGMMRKGMGAVTDDEVQNHSLIAFRAPHGSLPLFQVSSRGAIGNVGIPVDATGFSGMSGAAGLDTGSPEFSERYVISTKDETGVARLFTPALVKAFVDQPPMTWLHVQTSADWLLFYDPRIFILKPEDVEPALQRVRPIAALLLGTPA